MMLKKISKLFGYFLLILFNYIFICFTIYIVSAILLIKDIKPQNILIKEYQRNFYQKAGLMSIWQANPDCIEFDDKIIFKPKETTCEFNNLEFKTSLTFDENGRYSDNYRDITKKSVVVLGDSHAMGWGVNDNETFNRANAERYVLKVLEGDCETAVGAHAIIEGDKIILEAELFSLDGSQRFYEKKSSKIVNAKELGKDIGEILKTKSNNSYKK